MDSITYSTVLSYVRVRVRVSPKIIKENDQEKVFCFLQVSRKMCPFWRETPS